MSNKERLQSILENLKEVASEYQVKIDFYTAKLSKLRNMMRVLTQISEVHPIECPHCGIELPLTSTTCTGCGKEFDWDAAYHLYLLHKDQNAEP